jgi:hypothetical protein
MIGQALGITLQGLIKPSIGTEYRGADTAAKRALDGDENQPGNRPAVAITTKAGMAAQSNPGPGPVANNAAYANKRKKLALGRR